MSPLSRFYQSSNSYKASNILMFLCCQCPQASIAWDFFSSEIEVQLLASAWKKNPMPFTGFISQSTLKFWEATTFKLTWQLYQRSLLKYCYLIKACSQDSRALPGLVQCPVLGLTVALLCGRTSTVPIFAFLIVLEKHLFEGKCLMFELLFVPQWMKEESISSIFQYP